MTNEEFKAKWEKYVELDKDLFCSYEEGNVFLSIKGMPINYSVLLTPDFIENFKMYEAELRKDIRRVMKVAEFEVKSE